MLPTVSIPKEGNFAREGLLEEEGGLQGGGFARGGGRWGSGVDGEGGLLGVEAHRSLGVAGIPLPADDVGGVLIGSRL